jgi:hypothetical protein
MMNNVRTLTLVTMLAAATGCMMRPSGNTNQNENDNTADDQTAFELNIGGAVTEATRIGITTSGAVEGFCPGFFFPEAPNHLQTVTASLGMTITVTAAEPVGLWVLCGQSNFCGTDSGLNEQQINRFWTSGNCEIYVGSAQADDEVAYTLEFTAN